uniref:Putative secreted protein n=1 Tax=Anopheles marajoara TaxID=58244 RepID=A0A2M4CD08_9DIPT
MLEPSLLAYAMPVLALSKDVLSFLVRILWSVGSDSKKGENGDRGWSGDINPACFSLSPCPHPFAFTYYFVLSFR